MKRLNKKGFTLVELLAVIVVLALLMVVAASSIGTALENSKKKSLETEAKKILTNTYTELKSAIMVNGELPATTGTDSTDFSYYMVFNETTGAIEDACIQYKNDYYITASVTKDGKIEDLSEVDDGTCASRGEATS